MLLFHGSIMPVSHPLTTIGRTELDFGPGFYLTKNRTQAEKWAQTKASRQPNGLPHLNVYHFDESSFSQHIYKTKIFHAYTKEWLNFIALSRNGKEPWRGFDWIEGGIANDRVITTVDAYIDNLITVEQALGKLVNEELSHQICISCQEIIDKYLSFKEAVIL